jgi:hypothetical protein
VTNAAGAADLKAIYFATGEPRSCGIRQVDEKQSQPTRAILLDLRGSFQEPTDDDHNQPATGYACRAQG